MKRKERILDYLDTSTQKVFDDKSDWGSTASQIAEVLTIARYNVSRDLNQLVAEGQVIKIAGRPVLFLSRSVIEQQMGHQLTTTQFKNIVALKDVMNTAVDVEDYPFSELIGYDGSLENAVQQAKAALVYPPHGLHTLLTGPPGSGKTTFAFFMYQYGKAIHKLDEKSPYIIFNCADYASNTHLLLDHLFGHTKHAFTGAEEAKSGVVEAANGGILFLDEIHRLPPEGQEMLFSIIDRGEFYRLGESVHPRKVQVLIIGATTEDIQENILTTFRRRIPLTIQLPDLAKRGLKEKFQLIYLCFRQETKKLQRPLCVSEDVIRFFLQYDPKGNIGQLKNDIQLLCANALVDAMSTHKTQVAIKLSHLSTYLIDQFYDSKTNELIDPTTVEQLKTLKIKDMTFEVTNDNITATDSFLFLNDANLSKEILEAYDLITHKDKTFGALKRIVEARNQQMIEENEAKRHPIFKIVSRQNYELIVEILKEIANSEHFHLNSQNIEGLALHLDTLIEKVSEGYTFKDNIFADYSDRQKFMLTQEYQTAQKICARISQAFQITLPEREIYFISLYLRAMNETATEKKIGVLVLMHGNGAATDLAQTANELLKVDHAVGVNMPLTQSVSKTLTQVTQVVTDLDQGSGVLILSDMGSLNTFGEIISKKTGIKTATIKMVTTPMVIEATRKSLLPNVTLDLLAKDIKEESGYIGNSVSDLPDEQRASTELIDTVRKEKIIFILNESLTFLNAGQVYELLEQSAKNIAVKIPLEDYDAFWLKFLFHVSAMLERAIRDEQFPRRHVKAIIENDPKLYQYLRALLIPIENRYAIKIADGEISYLMELIQLNEQPKSSTQTAH